MKSKYLDLVDFQQTETDNEYYLTDNRAQNAYGTSPHGYRYSWIVHTDRKTHNYNNLGAPISKEEFFEVVYHKNRGFKFKTTVNMILVK